MARITKIKRDSLDLPEIFASGYQTDANGKVITGYKWKTHVPSLSQGIHTQFQLPDPVLVVNNVELIFLFVNGVQITADKISLQSQNSLVIYSNTEFSIDQDDVVEIKYVAA
jgi:hypothetical protein